MGEYQKPSNRLPRVDRRTDEHVWDFSPPDSAGDPGLRVRHTLNRDTVSIEYLGDRFEVPQSQVRWLAEVLLQETDLYRQPYVSDAHDDYTRPGIRDEDRR